MFQSLIVLESDNFTVHNHAIKESGLELRENLRRIKGDFVTCF